jgi:hypothetical protein
VDAVRENQKKVLDYLSGLSDIADEGDLKSRVDMISTIAGTATVMSKELAT